MLVLVAVLMESMRQGVAVLVRRGRTISRQVTTHMVGREVVAVAIVMSPRRLMERLSAETMVVVVPVAVLVAQQRVAQVRKAQSSLFIPDQTS